MNSHKYKVQDYYTKNYWGGNMKYDTFTDNVKKASTFEFVQLIED